MNWLRENVLLALGALALIWFGLRWAIKWVTSAPRTPDPWGPEVEEAVEREDAVALCQHCLSPQEHNGWFCPHCGAAVGLYCNCLPMVYPFSIGESVRAGIAGPFRRNWLTLTGYVLVAIAYLTLIPALVYILFLFPRLFHRPEELADQSTAS